MSRSPYWPDDTSVAPSKAHGGDWQAERFHPGSSGAIAWTAGRAPDLTCGHDMYTTGRLRSCGHCGSMHPADLAQAIRAGASVHWADFKYGWPHKVYADGVPNPYAGMRNSTTSTGFGSKLGEKDAHTEKYIAESGGEWLQLRSTMDDQKKPEFQTFRWAKVGVEQPTRHEKFYTVHLQDANAEDRDTIERAMRTQFQFKEDGSVRWRAYSGEPWGPWPEPAPKES